MTRRAGPGATLRSLSMRFRSVSQEASLFKSLHHHLQRLHRLEILGRDLGLRKGEIELGFDLEHQLDHIHRAQSDIYQPRLRVEIGGDRVLLEDTPDDGKNAVLDAGGKVLRSTSPIP